MHSLKFNFVRIAFACLLLTLGFTSMVSADTTFRIVIDDDNAPGTGCSYMNAAGSFVGGRWMLVGGVGNDGLISQMDWLECNGTDFLTPLGTRPWAIGHDSPPDQLDVLETSLPLGGRVGTYRLGFFSVNDLNTDEVDAVVTNQGDPITVVSPLILGTTDIPTLGLEGFLALALGLSAAGLLVLRKRRRGAGAALGLLLVLVGAGVAWAAVITVDGSPGDWGSVPPPPTSVLVSSSTNAAVNADIREIRAVYDMDTLFFRIDANLELTGPPTAVNDSYNATLNTPLSVAAAGVLANDVLNGAVILSYGAATGAEQTTIGAATPTSAGGSITLNANGSFNYNPPAGFIGSDTFKYVIENASASSTATVTFPVGMADQTISFTSTAPVGATVGGATYNVAATATSGLPVTFAIHAAASTVCSIAGSTVTFIGSGTCVITANQAGNAIYNPAPQVQQSFPVGQGTQTISFTSTAPAGATVGGAPYTVTATATSGLPVTFHDRRVGEHGVLDRGLHGVVHRCRHVHDQREPAGQRELQRRHRRCSSRSPWAKAHRRSASRRPRRPARRWAGALHGDGDGDIGPAGDVHDRRRGERGVLDRGRDGVVHRCRHVHDQRQPGGRRQLHPGAAGAAVVRRGAGLADDQLHLDGAGRCDGRRPTYTVTATGDARGCR